VMVRMRWASVTKQAGNTAFTKRAQDVNKGSDGW